MKKWLTGLMMLGIVALAAAIAVGFALATTGRASAQTPEPSDNEVNAVAKDLYCPVCENIPLDVCPTQACAQWRALIKEKLAAGWTSQQIKDYFVVQYGDRVLAEPPRHGLNWLVYILPPLALLAATLFVINLLRKMKAKAPAATGAATGAANGAATPPANAPAQSDDYLKRIEEELRSRK